MLINVLLKLGAAKFRVKDWKKRSYIIFWKAVIFICSVIDTSNNTPDFAMIANDSLVDFTSSY